MFKNQKPVALTTGSKTNKSNLRLQNQFDFQFTPVVEKPQVIKASPEISEILAQLRAAVGDCPNEHNKTLTVVISCAKCGEPIRIFEQLFGGKK